MSVRPKSTKAKGRVIKLTRSQLDDPESLVFELPDEESKPSEGKIEARPMIASSRLTLSSIRQNPMILSTLEPEALKVVRGLLFPQSRVFDFVVGVTVTGATDSSGNFGGAANGMTHSCATLSSAAEWSALQSLFDEVFVAEMHHVWMPYNRYAPQNVGLSGPGRYSVGLAMASLHHSAAVYTSAANMHSNPSVKDHHSGDPFKYIWKNIEKMDPKGICPFPAGTSSPTQGWCSTNTTSFGGYTGQAQFIGWDTISGNVSSTVGRFVVSIKAHFRNRA